MKRWMVWLPAYVAMALISGVLRGHNPAVQHISITVAASASYMLAPFLIGYWTWRALTPGKNVYASTAAAVVFSLAFIAYDTLHG